MTQLSPSRSRAWIVLSALCAGFLFSCTMIGCKSTELTSRWAAVSVVIDGRNEEWQNSLVRVEDTPAMIGLMNDRNYLYLALVTDDRALQRQIMFRGLTVWFDREGGNAKKFGIHYPTGIRFGDSREDRPSREMFQQDSSFRDRIPPVDTTQIDITGPAEGDQHLLPVSQLKDISVRMNLIAGTLVYEMRVPLTDNGGDPYAIGTSPGKKIGIGFETAVRGSAGRAGSSPEGNPRGGFGRGGGRRGEFGRGGGRMQGQTASPLSLWATVALADGLAAPNQ